MYFKILVYLLISSHCNGILFDGNWLRNLQHTLTKVSMQIQDDDLPIQVETIPIDPRQAETVKKNPIEMEAVQVVDTIKMNPIHADTSKRHIIQADAPKTHHGENSSRQFDFIIVGSGSARSVLANRLSEIENWNILLLEIGKPENDIMQYPILAPALQFTEYNWYYKMEPQNNVCLAMYQNRCHWPKGKSLGGSSSINYMIYTRGNHIDYDRWAALGNPGWSYQDVLPYFLKSENCRLKKFNPAYHSKRGYLNVEDPFGSEITTVFLKAGEELGFKTIDYNANETLGFSKFQGTTKLGRRHSAAKAFLKPVQKRKNLHILTESLVTKILIDPSTKTAYGVEYTRNGKLESALATKEVILSAGVLNSPQLLMLSGIGPEKHLREVGITPIVNLPVGQTLYDHIGFLGFEFNINKNVEPAENLYNATKILEWYKTGKGPLASLGGQEALAFVKTNASTEKEDYPDIEVVFVGSGSFPTDYGLINRRSVNIREDQPSFALVPTLLHPKSKGFMKLKSANIEDHPIFHGNYFSDPEEHDLKTMIAAMRFILKIAETDSFKKYNAQLNRTPFQDCESFAFSSDSYWKCVLQLLTSTLHHQISTCKMGPKEDPSSVVNHELRVHNINKLRVADSSVIPLPLSGDTNAPTIMIGEKAADIVKSEWMGL